MKGFPPSLALIGRLKATRKWPIATSKSILGHHMTALHDGKNLQEIARRAL